MFRPNQNKAHRGRGMKQIELGRTGIMVSDWCLGTMTFSTQTPQEDAHRQIDMALDAGLNFLDTAEMYPVNPMRKETVGNSEKCIADWISKSGRREDVVIATKAGGDSPLIRGGAGFTPENILDVLDGNLARLGTDYIDLYQLHWPARGSYMFRQNWTFDPSGQDRAQTMDHIGGVLEKLKQAQADGKIRAFGLSNESAWGTTKWIDVAQELGAPRVASVQNEYSLLCRLYDTDMAEMSVNEDVVCFSFSPLAAGLLTGKYQNGAVPDGSRMTFGPQLGGRVQPRVFDAVDAYLKVAEKHAISLAHMAMAFQRSRPFKVSAIFGASTSTQLAELLEGKDLELSDDVLADIDAAHRAHPMPF
jgi:aryl-alcohol dehydrogenase-like predicted oxidoreductase